jgi:hypothetical protein
MITVAEIDEVPPPRRDNPWTRETVLEPKDLLFSREALGLGDGTLARPQLTFDGSES